MRDDDPGGPADEQTDGHADGQVSNETEGDDREPSTGDGAPPSVEDEPEDLPSANELLGTLFEETSLWPLLVVMLTSLGAFGAALIVLTIIDRSPFAALALLLLLGMTTDTLIRARSRPPMRNLARLIVLFWIVSSGLAIVAITTGIA
jgi:hypothetical protein